MTIEVPASRPLYVFIDESGNFDFSDKGSTHFLMAAHLATDAGASAQAMTSLGYELMTHDLPRTYFHATEDSSGVRKRVLDVICSLSTSSYYAVYLDKHYAHPKVQSPERLYSIGAKAIARYVIKRARAEFSPVVFLYDAAVSAKHRGVLQGALKAELKQSGRRFNVHFSQLKYDANGQIADYAAWSLFRKLERGDGQYWDRLVQSRPNDVILFDLFQRGTTRYY